MKKGSVTSIAADSGINLHALEVEEIAERRNNGERNSRGFSPKTENRQNFQQLLEELRAPLGDLIKQRVAWTDRSGREHHIEYVEWHTVADILDRVAPEWSYSIRGLQQVGDLLAVTAAITINGVTREGVGTGPAGSEMGIKKAESDALKRAARMFGIARDLYKDSDEEEIVARPTSSESRAETAPPERQNTNVRDPHGFPLDPLAHSNEELVTPRQLVAIRAIASSIGIEVEAECQRLLKCDIKEISRRAASAFIDHLKTRASMARG
ncbi:MAG: Rad52/Rad22 family DNA repair protein [Acidobacteriota bacterium]